MDDKKIEISTAGLSKLLNKSYESFNEERDLALERYRRQDETIQSVDDFIVQGKFNVDYLKLASERSNAIFGLGKLIADIVYKDASGDKGTGGGGGANDAEKAEILKLLKELEDNDSEPPVNP